jgi:cell division topological specificity factor
VLDFFNKFFRPLPPSGATAKERLRLVLLSDHLSLAPDVVEALKRDLLAVISRYVEIDPAHADVTFERRDHDVAMLASIPITGVRRPGYDESPEPTPPPAPRRARYDAPGSAPASGGVAVAKKAQAPSGPVSLELPMAAEPVPTAPVAAVSSASEEAPPKSAATSAAHRRRRRRRKANAAAKRNAQAQSDPPMNASAQA